MRDADLAASDGLVGPSDVLYPAGARQAELAAPVDTITVSTAADIDQIRVITARHRMFGDGVGANRDRTTGIGARPTSRAGLNRQDRRPVTFHRSPAASAGTLG